MANSAALETLDGILRDWPKSLTEHEEAIRSRLKGRVADALPLPSLRLVPVGEWRLACPLAVRSEIGKCLICDTKKTSLPVLAEIRLAGENWLLTQFEQQCSICFGSGINNGNICDLCFGTGWGYYV